MRFAFLFGALFLVLACESGGGAEAPDLVGAPDVVAAPDLDGPDDTTQTEEVAEAPLCSARAFGAVGDGRTLDTAALQAAIDACKDIGGVVVVEPGTYYTGSIHLGSDMTLRLEEGAVILGSTERADYTNQALVYGADLRNLTVEGPGEMNGNGLFWWSSILIDPEKYRPSRLFRIDGCENLHIRDLRMRDSAKWHLHIVNCEHVLIEGVHIRAKVHDNELSPNTDGIDIEGSRHVVVRGCDIETGDDAIVLKQDLVNGVGPMYDIEVYDCVLASWANAFKIGTRPEEEVYDVHFRDSVIQASVDSYPGTRAMGGITILADAGADVHGILVENIHMKAVHSPFFLRVQERQANEDGGDTAAGRLYDVTLRDITVDDHTLPALVMGIPGHPVENVHIENYTANSTEGGRVEDRDIVPPERNLEYPDAVYFGKFPSYGLYARHVSGPLVFGPEVDFTSSAPVEERPAVVIEDVWEKELGGLAEGLEVADRDAGQGGRWTGRWVPGDERVHVLRDEWGVPHVVAREAWGVGYGVGWAQAEDQLAHLLRNLWIGQGRVAEIDGPSVLNVDRTMRLVRLVADVEAHWDEFDPLIHEVTGGFAAGVNAFMAAHPERVPEWAEPIQPSWPVAFARYLFLTGEVGSANGKREGLAPSLATLAFDGVNEFGNTELPGGLLDPARKGWFDNADAESPTGTGLAGSNAWAVAPSRTGDEGVGFHLGDTHSPFNGTWRLWELHLRSADFEAAGAAFLGLPVPIFARNAHVVWSFTMNGPNNGDTYRLTLDPEDPERYLLDGESLPFTIQDEVFRVAGGEDVTLRLRWSVHGPVTWVNADEGYAVAYRLASFGQPWVTNQFARMLTSRNLDELEQALALAQLSRFHVTAADTQGHILYRWNARLPDRPDGFDWNRMQDGSSSASLWPQDPPIDWFQLPGLRDPDVGFVQNCNNEPWNTTGTAEDPLRSDFVGYGWPGDGDSERAWRVRQAFAPGEVITHDVAYGVATESVMIAAPVLLPLLREAWNTWGAEHPDAARLSDAMGVLAGWEGDADPIHAGPTIFLLFTFQMFERTFLPMEPLAWTLADLDEALGQRMLDALSQGLDAVVSLIGAWRVPWGAFHGIKVGERRFAVALAQYPAVSLYNCNVDPFNDPDLSCRIGSAYTFFSRLEEPIRTWSALPTSQADDPDKPYFYEMTKVYARGELKPLAFSDAELAERNLSETILEPVAGQGE